MLYTVHVTAFYSSSELNFLHKDVLEKKSLEKDCAKVLTRCAIFYNI